MGVPPAAAHIKKSNIKQEAEEPEFLPVRGTEHAGSKDSFFKAQIQ